MRSADALLDLKRGWDGYGGQPTDRPTLEMAKRVGEALAGLVPSYQPEYVPAGDGSVQVEWHAEGWDIEVWIQRVASGTEGEDG